MKGVVEERGGVGEIALTRMSAPSTFLKVWLYLYEPDPVSLPVEECGCLLEDLSVSFLLCDARGEGGGFSVDLIEFFSVAEIRRSS